MAGPNETSTPFGDTDNLSEGVYKEQETLDLSLSEEDILTALGTRIEDSQSWWDNQLNLKQVRRENEMRWLNQNFEVSGSDTPYDFQADYRDNRIFLSVETLASYLVNRIPEPIVVEAFDTDASRELAENFGMVLKGTAHELMLREKLQMIARHLLMGYRLGIMKITWDDNAGFRNEDGTRSGFPFVNWVRPHKIILESETENFNDAELIAENISSSVEELGYKFPDKKDEILTNTGLANNDKTKLGKKIKYWEAWFTYYDNDGNKSEAVAWKFNDLLLDYDSNPYFNYDEGTNFFDAPKKPYVGFNFLKMGKWALDDTSLTEQSAKLQDILERRGRQIVDNADQAHSTKVFNTQMISAKAVQKYIGKPTQNIMVKGDVRQAFKREAPPLLPSYVLQDKYDARAEIDNIFGTHAPLRGEKTDAPTLGQEIISQKSDLGRVQVLATAIERGAEEVYKHIAQIYKVFGTEQMMFKYTGDEGPTTFIEFSGDKIEDGVQIKIQAGSTLPDDKTVDKMEAIELAKLQGQIDPLTLMEKMHIPNPKKAAARIVRWLLDPARYMQEDLQAEGDGQGAAEASRTIKRILAGENVPPKQDASREYLNVIGRFMESPQFQQVSDEQKALLMAHVQATTQQAKSALGKNEDQSQGGFMGRIRSLFGA